MPSDLEHKNLPFFRKIIYSRKKSKSTVFKNTIDNFFLDCGMSERLFILLQSLVASCQSLDTTNLDHLETELWKLIGNEEKDLLRILVKIYLDF